MKYLMHFSIPNEPFNTYMREGTAEEKIGAIVEAINPEATYFTTTPEGSRGGIFVVNVDSPSQFPDLAEPLFLTFNASVNFGIAMTPEDLAKGTSLTELGKKWG